MVHRYICKQTKKKEKRKKNKKNEKEKKGINKKIGLKRSYKDVVNISK